MTTINNDTIVAISTPHGMGGIAVVRVSGDDAISIVAKRWKGAPISEMKSHTAHFGRLLDTSGELLDEVVIHGSPEEVGERLRARAGDWCARVSPVIYAGDLEVRERLVRAIKGG